MCEAKLNRPGITTEALSYLSRRLTDGGLAGGGFNDLMNHRSFWGLGRPLGCFNAIQKGGGLRPPPFRMVLKPAGAVQTPKRNDVHSNH